MFVRDRMASPVVTADERVTLAQVDALLHERRFRQLPVLRGGALVGIVTRGDVLDATPVVRSEADFAGYRRALLDTRCGDIMRRDPITVDPGDTLDAAAQRMLEHRISALPVVAEGRLVGILTQTDLFRALIELLGIAGQSARMTYDLDDQGPALIRLVQSLLDKRLQVLNLATFTDRRSGRPKALVRVRGGTGDGRPSSHPALPVPGG